MASKQPERAAAKVPARRTRSPLSGKPEAQISPEELHKLAQLHCTIAEAAAFFGVTEKTVDRHLKRRPECREAWDSGYAMGRMSLRRLQWRHAEGAGMSAVHMTIWLSKQHLGETDRVEHAGKGGGPIQIVISAADAKL